MEEENEEGQGEEKSFLSLVKDILKRKKVPE